MRLSLKKRLGAKTWLKLFWQSQPKHSLVMNSKAWFMQDAMLVLGKLAWKTFISWSLGPGDLYQIDFKPFSFHLSGLGLVGETRVRHSQGRPCMAVEMGTGWAGAGLETSVLQCHCEPCAGRKTSSLCWGERETGVTAFPFSSRLAPGPRLMPWPCRQGEDSAVFWGKLMVWWALPWQSYKELLALCASW